MRKKLIAPALLGGVMLCMMSCNKESTFHATSVTYPYQSLLYADQTLDSIKFQTTDDWTLETPNDWIHVQGETSGTISEKALYVLYKNDVIFDENQTDSTRIGSIAVNSHFNAYALYIQLGCIEISHPVFTIKSYYKTTNVPTKVEFTLADSANVTTDSICFNARKDWTLEVKGDGKKQPWATLSRTEGSAGMQKVTLSMEQNPDTLARELQAVLTSGDVKNNITIRQYGKPKKKKD